MWESVDIFIKYYKEVVLVGDNQIMVEIEIAFYRLEFEKNKLFEEVLILIEEIISGKERYIRMQVDFDNFRKRLEKERFSVRNDV